MEAQRIKVSREGGKSGTAEHPPTGGCEDQSPKWQGCISFAIWDPSSYKLQFSFHVSWRDVLVTTIFFWLNGSDPRALLLTPITWGEVNLESGSRGGL